MTKGESLTTNTATISSTIPHTTEIPNKRYTRCYSLNSGINKINQSTAFTLGLTAQSSQVSKVKPNRLQVESTI